MTRSARYVLESRPFTVFRWRPGRDARYKKTQICQTCCKLKNVCQVCLLDLEYGLPVQVRDTAVSIDSNDAIPKSDVNREYFAEEHDRKARARIDCESSYGKVRASDTILKLQRTTPYYKRNRAHVCSFFIRGPCTRGPECPYRHEMPETGELSQQNIKDRYYGINDPVALKLLSKAGEMPSLEPPEVESVRTLYVGGLDARITEQDLRDNFYAHGEIESIKMVIQRACAFVTYTTREGTEKAAEELANKLVIKGLRMKLLWGKPEAPKPESEGSDQASQQAAVAHSGLLPRAVISQQQTLQPTDIQNQPPMPYFNIPTLPEQDRAYYPSMDPQRMGALTPSRGIFKCVWPWWIRVKMVQIRCSIKLSNMVTRVCLPHIFHYIHHIIHNMGICLLPFFHHGNNTLSHLIQHHGLLYLVPMVTRHLLTRKPIVHLKMLLYFLVDSSALIFGIARNCILA